MKPHTTNNYKCDCVSIFPSKCIHTRQFLAPTLADFILSGHFFYKTVPSFYVSKILKKNFVNPLSLSSIRTSYKIHSFESVSRSWLNELLNAHNWCSCPFSHYLEPFLWKILVYHCTTLPVAMFFEFEKSILHCQQQ